MNLKQIFCYIRTLGRHVEPMYSLNQHDHYCTKCGYYLFTLCDSKDCLQELRNSSKMWWETPE